MDVLVDDDISNNNLDGDGDDKEEDFLGEGKE